MPDMSRFGDRLPPITFRTGSSNTTLTFNCDPCPKCGGRDRSTGDFHGHLLTTCMHCGEELPHA
jgi:hypothetical protein